MAGAAFVGIPVGFAAVSVHFGGTTHQVAADRGGVVDAMIRVDLGRLADVHVLVEDSLPVEARAFIVAGEGARRSVWCRMSTTP